MVCLCRANTRPKSYSCNAAYSTISSSSSAHCSRSARPRQHFCIGWPRSRGCERHGATITNRVKNPVSAHGCCQVLERVSADDIAQLVNSMIHGAGLQQLRKAITRQCSNDVAGASMAGGEQEHHQGNSQQRIELHETI